MGIPETFDSAAAALAAGAVDALTRGCVEPAAAGGVAVARGATATTCWAGEAVSRVGAGSALAGVDGGVVPAGAGSGVAAAPAGLSAATAGAGTGVGCGVAG